MPSFREMLGVYSQRGNEIPQALGALSGAYAQQKLLEQQSMQKQKMLEDEALAKAKIETLGKQTPYKTIQEPISQYPITAQEETVYDGIPLTGMARQEISNASIPKEQVAIPEFMKAKTPEQMQGITLKPNPISTGLNANADITWEKATPEQKRLAVGIYNGNIDVNTLGFRERTVGNILANEYANLQGGTYQSYSGKVKGGMAGNLAYGKMGSNVLALNTGIGHAGDALSAYENVKNTDIALLNKPINWLKKNINDPNIIALDLNLNALAGELATIFKGSGGTDQEIAHWANVLSSDLTPTQAQSALNKITELLNSRIGAIEYQQNNVMTQSPVERKLISPKSEKTMERLKTQGTQPKVNNDPLGIR